MTAGHFIFIPATLLVGIIIGWILGSRAAMDAMRSQQKRADEKTFAQLRGRSGPLGQRAATNPLR